jgi:hypothetical protein
VEETESTRGKRGQMQGARMVAKPARKLKKSRKIINPLLNFDESKYVSNFRMVTDEIEFFYFEKVSIESADYFFQFRGQKLDAANLAKIE